MNNIPKNSLKICAALAISALAPAVHAQPINQTHPQLGVAVVAGADAKPLITLHASETSAAAILSLLAARTGTRIIVKSDAPIDSLEFKRVPLAEAIAQIAKAANLKLETQGPPGTDADRIYIVGEIEIRPDVKSPFNGLDMDFKDIPVSQLVKTLAEQFHINTRVDPTVPQKNIDIVMFNVTPIEALQTIADAADFGNEQNGERHHFARTDDRFKIHRHFCCATF